MDRFNTAVGASDHADFETITDAMNHYRRLPWWKRIVIAVFGAHITVETGRYPQKFKFARGVSLLIEANQRVNFTVLTGEVEIFEP